LIGANDGGRARKAVRLERINAACSKFAGYRSDCPNRGRAVIGNSATFWQEGRMNPAGHTTRRQLLLTLLAAFLGWLFDGMEMGIFPLVARPALQQMQSAQGIPDEGFVQQWMGVITALFLLGAAVGGLVFGWLGDKIGRVRAMTLSILCYSLFAGLSYFAQAPWQLGALRFLGALGMGGEWSLGVALVMECWPKEKRPLMAGLIGAAANLGYALIALIAMRFKVESDSWRWVMLIGATPAALTFLIRLFVPESERWVESQKHGPTQPVREIFRPPLLRNTLLAICFASVALIVTWGIVQWIPLWADQMAQASGAHDARIKAYAQFSAALGAVVGSLAAPLLGLRIGRRLVYFALCLTSLLACQWLFRQFHSTGGGFLPAIFVVGACTASFYGWLPQYLPELFPTRARATGQGLSFNFGRILAAVGAWHMGDIMAYFGKDYARAGTAVSLVYIVGMASIWLAPETRDKPLPD
jgi:MFS family permease